MRDENGRGNLFPHPSSLILHPLMAWGFVRGRGSAAMKARASARRASAYRLHWGGHQWRNGYRRLAPIGADGYRWVPVVLPRFIG